MIETSLKTMGRTCTGKGKTLIEAILDLKPEVARGVGILTVKRGDKVIEKVLQPHIVQNLFNKVGRLQREIAIKNISSLFGVIE